MTKKSIAIALALIVAVMPFLGFSGEIKDLYYTVAGVLVASLIHLSSVAYCNVCKSKIDNGLEQDEDGADESEDAYEADIDEGGDDSIEGIQHQDTEFESHDKKE